MDNAATVKEKRWHWQKLPEVRASWWKRFCAAAKAQCMDAYGGQRCVICGETRLPFLVLARIRRDEPRLKVEFGFLGGSFYYKLKKLGFPKKMGLEVRCLNCNAKAMAEEHPRIRCLQHYGGNPPQCACCGIEDLDLLTLHHVDGAGNQHRKTLKRRGVGFYRRLVQLGFPKKPALQVLCWNCNRGAYNNGGMCPHKVAPA
jgi:hypothetical protein